MTIYRQLKMWMCGVAAAGLLALAGCGGSGTTGGAANPTGGTPPTTGSTVSVTPTVLLSSITTAVSNPLNIARSLGGWDWVSFGSNFGTLLTSITYTLDMQKVTYQSIGADGLSHTMSGLLILPRALVGARPSVPILMYQHGTEPYRPYSPS